MIKYLIIGSGLSGSVVAEQLASKGNCKIIIFEERNHIGGNCYTEQDKSTGITSHIYGPHIFNTNNVEVWNYVNRFCKMIPYINRVKTIYNDQVYSMPINLHTINQFYKKRLNPDEAKEFIKNVACSTINEPKNFEEQAIKFIGHDLYKAFFYGYTKKQWGCEPKELPASILKRLPIRFNYDDNYYTSLYQGIPKNGYTDVFKRMLNNPNIEIRLNTKFDENFDTSDFEHIFYTGPIDSFFNYKYGRLGYRTVYFERGETIGDYQGNAVINYANIDVPYTRIHEHKHFTPWEQFDKTIYFKEYSKETTNKDIPFYPKRLREDMEKLKLYEDDVKRLSRFTFLGRLATYKYMNMDHVIEEALHVVKNIKL